MGLQEDRPVSRWQKMVFLGSPKRSVRPEWLIRAKKSALSEPHVCANTCRHLLLDPVLSRHPPCSLVQVMLTLEDRDVKWFTWAVVLTSLGYLLLLLVSIFPFWVRLVKDESQEVFFSGLFENCFQIKCWKPRPLSIYIVLGRVFLLCAVLFSFLTVFAMVSFASDLFPGTWKHNLVSAFISFLTGACAFLALLLHALEMQSLRMKPNPPHFSVQWPYYALGFSILLFAAAGAICLVQETTCLCCHWLLIPPNTGEIQGIAHLESLGGDLSSMRKETLLKGETAI
uniref:Transmembrane protein 225 domain-containing protein n=1 Tax=Sus scrofa TaxID=9823 RepID=A0A8D0NQ14_PIG